ncbi:Histidine kinase [Dyadobacter soli]|uniref:Histidine kinase n=1 Tax=Dyadobacter soli TaxID=659014 RepID=A0A1G7LPI0_9BACT|nr:histidine kinase [Dyadobacter soli]SDF51301.1 Histidine kinase [Dyadobacter soli]
MAGTDPHFLINVISSMAELARQKSEHLEGALMQLSDLLLYTTYQSQAERVTLQQEADHLRNFMALQKLRFATSVRIDLDMHIDADTAGYFLEPLLLVPFVAHAFNCGATSLAEPFINVRLAATAGKLTLTVENTYDPDPFNATDGHWGAGLENLRTQLSLKYPQKHSLISAEKDNAFQVRFELILPNPENPQYFTGIM